jgi:branched-chain amino acid transport system ATP-binding protein
VATLLKTKDLTIVFGGLRAVDGVDMEVEEGEIRALIGPNGSGKTTFINMVTGVYTPTKGQVLWCSKGEEEDITGKAPHVITARGIARTFQNIRIFPALDARTNIMIAEHCRTKAKIWDILANTKAMREEESRIYKVAEKHLGFVGLADKAEILAKSLPHGERRLLEIARALATQPKLLILDEPAAGMNPSEAQSMVERLKEIRDFGVTILLIEHNMRVAMSVSDKVTVLNFGQKICEGAPQEVQNDDEVIAAYLGRTGSHATH